MDSDHRPGPVPPVTEKVPSPMQIPLLQPPGPVGRLLACACEWKELLPERAQNPGAQARGVRVAGKSQLRVTTGEKALILP